MFLTTTHRSRETGVGHIAIGFVIEIPKERVVSILEKTVCFSSVMCYALCCDERDAAPVYAVMKRGVNMKGVAAHRLSTHGCNAYLNISLDMALSSNDC